MRAAASPDGSDSGLRTRADSRKLPRVPIPPKTDPGLIPLYSRSNQMLRNETGFPWS